MEKKFLNPLNPIDKDQKLTKEEAEANNFSRNKDCCIIANLLEELKELREKL